MPPLTLSARVSDCLKRYISALQSAMSGLAQAEDVLSRPDHQDDSLGPLLAGEQRRQRDIAALAEELRLMQREWNQGATATEDERCTVRALADEAADWSERVGARYHQLSAKVEQRKCQVSGVLHDLKEGRRTVQKFSLGLNKDAGRLDRQA